jgi:hypothetical protein
VQTRRGSGSPERDDLPDLGKRQSKPPRLLDEREDAQGRGGVDAVSRCRTTRSRQDPPRLVQSQGLPGCSAAFGHLSDQESVPFHVLTVNPSPWGKVKGFNLGPRHAHARGSPLGCATACREDRRDRARPYGLEAEATRATPPGR